MLLPDSMELRICVPYNSRSTAWASFDGRGRVELRRSSHLPPFLVLALTRDSRGRPHQGHGVSVSLPYCVCGQAVDGLVPFHLEDSQVEREGATKVVRHLRESHSRDPIQSILMR
jgi:hypothetical protein